MNKIKSLIIALVLSMAMVNPANAAECHTVYGGGEVCETCNISVDKQVWNNQANAWWDNIDSSNYTFKAGEEVRFRMVVRNTSDIDVHSIELRDYLPSYLEFVSASTDDGHNYEYRADGHYVIYYLGTIAEGDEDVIYLTAKVKDVNNIPVGITTLTNKAEAKSGSECNDTDYANLAISRAGQGTILGTVSPETGSNSLVLMVEGLGFVVMAGAYGIALKKRK